MAEQNERITNVINELIENNNKLVTELETIKSEITDFKNFKTELQQEQEINKKVEERVKQVLASQPTNSNIQPTSTNQPKETTTESDNNTSTNNETPVK